MKSIRKISINLLTVTLAGFFFVSCEKEEKYTIDCSDGVFIINEGAMNSSNGSVDFYSNADDIVVNDVFKKVNGRGLGDVVQSVTVVGDTVYMVVNNSNKIEAANIKTMIGVGVISGLNKPRYMVNQNKTAYVSCWDDNSVKVIDLNTFSVTGTIATGGFGPEKMLIANNKLYVLNSNDSTISVINTTTNTEIDKIVVPYNPKDIVIDGSGYLWVLSYGNEFYNDDWTAIIGHTPSYIYKIDPATDQVMGSAQLFAEKHPAHLEIDNDGSSLYIGGGYSYGGITKIDVSGESLTLSDISSEYFYGFNIDAETGVIFATLSGDYTSPGTLKRLETDGSVIGTYSCGIGTSGAAFKHTH